MILLSETIYLVHTCVILEKKNICWLIHITSKHQNLITVYTIWLLI